ncbi:MAG: mannitol dehydrogenase family protein [Paracoccaceae bacterium]
MIQTPIVQFGTSRFLQAHVDLFVSEALIDGNAVGKVVVVQSSGDPGRARRLAALAAPEGYPVRIKGLLDGERIDTEVRVTSVARTLSTQTDWLEIKRVFTEEAEFILSNTGDTGFAPSTADSSNEFGQKMSYPAKLMHLLLARFEANARPIQIMPMELIVNNGLVLQKLVGALAMNQSNAFRVYLDNDVTWVNSLVDRIVSEPLEPAGAIAEPYALWAIEAQPRLKLPCQHPSVKVVDNLDEIESLKLFILNLGHTYLAQRWLETGDIPNRLVREVVGDSSQLADLKLLYQDEVLPGFTAAGMEQDAQAYIDTTLERFANPYLDHRLADIGQNHNEKVDRRIGAFLKWAKSHGDQSPKPRLQKIVVRLGDSNSEDQSCK